MLDIKSRKSHNGKYSAHCAEQGIYVFETYQRSSEEGMFSHKQFYNQSRTDRPDRATSR